MKLNINTDGVRQASSDELSESASRLIVNLEDLASKHGPSRAQALINGWIAKLENESSIDALISGSTNNAGQPVAAIGAGSPSGNGLTIEELREAVRNSPFLPPQDKLGLEKALNRDHPEHMEFAGNGVPVALVHNMNERDTLKRELEQERDEKSFGSLAEKLASEQRAHAATRRELDQANASGNIPHGVKAKLDSVDARLKTVHDKVDSFRTVLGRRLPEQEQILESINEGRLEINAIAKGVKPAS